VKNLLFFLLIILPIGLQAKVGQKINIEIPSIVMEGVEYEIKVTTTNNLNDSNYQYADQTQYESFPDWKNCSVRNGTIKIKHTFKKSTRFLVQNKTGESIGEKEVRVIPLWMSIIPPLLAIFLALIFKEVLASLFTGIFSGTLIVGLYNNGFSGIFTGFTNSLKHLVNAVANHDHAYIILFSILIGGMVSVISANGGMAAVVVRIGRFAKNAVGAQFATWLLGIGIFFDDYANTLVVGNTMRPMTDKLGVSREKLAYIVDSTAAPITAIALVSTWIGAELGYIQEGLDKIGASALSEMSVYSIFLSSIKYSFYPILALLFILIIVFMKKDFGPMHKAETAARLNPVKDIESNTSGVKSKSYNALIPIGVLIFGTILSLLHTGSNGEFWDSPMDTLSNLSTVIGNANSYVALLISSTLALFASVTLTVSQRIFSLTKTMEYAMDGFKSMLNAIVILVLAWALSAVTQEMHTANFIQNLLVGNVAPIYLPLITFIVSTLVAFSTGSSWSTMAIVYATLLPAVYLTCMEAGMPTPELLEIFYNTVSCVLAGAVLGDHCSPISDTTILSSLASGCNHLAHVRTQMPYALVVGVVAIVLGTLLSSIGVPIWLCYALALIVLFLVVKLFGKSVANL